MRVERLPVDEDDYSRFRPGDGVEVRVAPGLVGIPWVYSVLRRDLPATARPLSALPGQQGSSPSISAR